MKTILYFLSSVDHFPFCTKGLLCGGPEKLMCVRPSVRRFFGQFLEHENGDTKTETLKRRFKMDNIEMTRS